MLARLNTPEKSDTVEYFRPRRDKNDIAGARGLKRQKKERQALRAHELAVGTMAFVESKKEGNVTGEPSTAEVSPARTCDWRGGKEPTRDACDRVTGELKGPYPNRDGICLGECAFRALKRQWKSKESEG
jgi:hypothetical protein